MEFVTPDPDILPRDEFADEVNLQILRAHISASGFRAPMGSRLVPAYGFQNSSMEGSGIYGGYDSDSQATEVGAAADKFTVRPSKADSGGVLEVEPSGVPDVDVAPSRLSLHGTDPADGNETLTRWDFVMEDELRQTTYSRIGGTIKDFLWTKDVDGVVTELMELTTSGVLSVLGVPVLTSVAFNDLTDVTITAAATGDYIRFDGAAWVDVAVAQLLTDLKTVDGAGSGLDADLLDGNSSAAFALASHTHAAADIVSGTLALARGGTNADLSATGGSSFVLRQSSAGAAITVSQLAASNLSNGTTGSGGGVVLATAPTITGGIVKELTEFSLRESGGTGFDLRLLSTDAALSGDRILTLNTNNGNRTVSLSANVTIGGTLTTASIFTTTGANAIELATTGATNLTLPTSGTLAITTQKLDDWGAPEDNTDLNATTLVHGLLPKLSGNAAQFLDGTGAWTAPSGGTTHDLLSGTHTDTTASAVSRGSVIVGDATPKWAELVIGAANRVLFSDGTDAAWAQVPLASAVSGTLPIANGGTGQTTQTAAFDALDPLTTTGQIIYHNGTNSVALSIGSTDDVLTVAGGVPTWAAPTGGGTVPKGYIWDLTMSNAADTVNDITVAAGEATDEAGGEVMILAAAITKQLDAAWAVGDNAGGINTGSVAANTWYEVHLIKRSDTGVVDVMFTTTANRATLPANYDLQRRIGWIRRNGSTILQFTQVGDHFTLTTQINDVATTATATAAAVTLTVPPSSIARFRAGLTSNTSVNTTNDTVFSEIVEGNVTPDNTTGIVSIGANDIQGASGGHYELRVSSTSTIEHDSDGTTYAFDISTFGWIDDRRRFKNA